MTFTSRNTAYYVSALFMLASYFLWQPEKVQPEHNPVLVAQDCYDFIVVGAGAAGCVVARRLSEKYRVLLLEWGGEPKNPGLDVPALSKKFLTDDDFMHFYHTVPQQNAGLRTNGIVTYPAGKVFGGTSAINAMFFNRGNPNDYDNWASITGDSSWKYEEMLKYFKRIEDYHGEWPLGKYHAKGCPITVSRQQYAPGLDTWLKAGASLGYPDTDPNALQTASFIPIEFNKRDGLRVNSYLGYVKQAIGTSSNLTVISNVKVNKILFDANKASGVQYVTTDGRKVIVCVSKEVILSAGVISSPVVLMKSGIGPKEVLDGTGITPIKYLPVGRNLHDHPLLQISILMKKDKIQVFDPERDLNPRTLKEFNKTGDGPYSCYNGLTGQAFVVSSVRAKEQEQVPSSLWPDLHLMLMQTPSNIVADTNKETESNDVENMSISALILLTRPKSRLGTIALNKTNTEEDPLIDFQFFSHPDDMEAMIDGIQQVLNLFENTTAYQEKGAHYHTEPLKSCKNFVFRSREYWKCYVKYIVDSGVHGAGTCRMGKGPDDPEAVVDSKLKVIGVENVRVADCSIMPVVTNANPQVPAMVIGEKVAADILVHWSQYD